MHKQSNSTQWWSDSGFGGSVVACRLAEARQSVCVLERFMSCHFSNRVSLLIGHVNRPLNPLKTARKLFRVPQCGDVVWQIDSFAVAQDGLTVAEIEVVLPCRMA